MPQGRDGFENYRPTTRDNPFATHKQRKALLKLEPLPLVEDSRVIGTVEDDVSELLNDAKGG